MGVTPRRNPELVVAVLWQNGEFSYYPARIGAQVVAAFVNKKRRLAGNLPPEKAAAPVEVGAVWTTPDSGPIPAAAKRRAQQGIQGGQIHSGHFFVDGNGIVAENPKAAQKTRRNASGRAKPLAHNSAGDGNCQKCAAGRSAVARAAKGTATLMPLRRFLSFRDFDWALLGLVLLLCTMSVLEVHSATVHTKFASFGSRQIFFVAAGIVGMFILAKIDYHRLLDLAPWFYGIFVVSLVAVKLVGHKALGARRWIASDPSSSSPPSGSSWC